MINGFAGGAVQEQNGKCKLEGRHNLADNQLKSEIPKVARSWKVRRNRRNRRLKPRANVLRRNFDERMQSKVEKQTAIYYNDAAGIDINYPEGSKQLNLLDLETIKDNANPNKINVVVGCKKTSQKELTFIVLKVSDNQREIAPKKMKKFSLALKRLLEKKPSVIRGSLRNGVTQKYVCEGFRKNPSDKDIGKYASKAGVSATEQKKISEGIKDLVRAIEERATTALNGANLHNCAGLKDFIKAKLKYCFPSVNKEGHATQVAVSIAYCSRVHTDKDFFLTVLSVYDEKAGPEEVLYNFCFPTCGVAIPMRSGDIIVFNPLVPHCATNPTRETSMIYSCYVSKKTCNTVGANVMDSVANEKDSVANGMYV